MTDALGSRMVFGVLVPSTNTAVQPEYDSMRPPGVTNHISRIIIPNNPVNSDADFSQLMNDIRGATMAAVDAIVTCEPDALIMGMSAETFWDGVDGANTLQDKLQTAAGGRKVTMASDACQAALRCYDGVKRVAVITPYMPVGDAQVHRFFTECGFDVSVVHGLRCSSPTAIANVSEASLRDAILAVDGPNVDAIVQVGTNLAMARLAAVAEEWLGKPVLAINTATYWHALRSHGIGDRVGGYGSLLERF
ncbi:arylmalonate decarboxylase [Acidisphaera sp. L21]|uniref:maleate cis-trans isomerase family protein n=1 Tax=Acidisphaera sp. L21 TaxID=1641851 RepID=UPI00131D4000|nr:arylmalonate decarboxylase [Acidisphaera sp. L21]